MIWLISLAAEIKIDLLIDCCCRLLGAATLQQMLLNSTAVSSLVNLLYIVIIDGLIFRAAVSHFLPLEGVLTQSNLVEVTLKDKGVCSPDAGGEGHPLFPPHLINLSNTEAQSELSLRTSMLLLRLSRISSNTGLCRESTRAWAWITFTSSALGVSTRSDTSLPLPWIRRASRRCTRTKEWLMVSPLLPPSWAPSAFAMPGFFLRKQKELVNLKDWMHFINKTKLRVSYLLGQIVG